jgi:hypothetical protein
MRQLIGKIAIEYRGVIEEVYLSEDVRCQNCQGTVALGIEVVTVRKKKKKSSKRQLGTLGTAEHTALIMRSGRRVEDQRRRRCFHDRL